MTGSSLAYIENKLRRKLLKEEAAYFSKKKDHVDSLWCHSSRVAAIAEKLGKEERMNPIACRLAGLFHDSGKFVDGRYHDDDLPEEQRSAELLRDIAQDRGIDAHLLDQVEESILQLYRNDPNPTHLTKILFDADNLDKLGLLGVSNFFTKVGLRGGGLSESVLYQLTVELTYARYTSKRFLTQSGKALAKQRSTDTIGFFKQMLCHLREEGIFDFCIREVTHNDITIDVVEPSSCSCGKQLERYIKDNVGIKCKEIHLEHFCDACGVINKFKFCEP